MKKHPLESSLEFSDSLNYENTIEHVLVRARKIHESVPYQAFFFLFFELAKNEDGTEFSFLDSLKFLQERGDTIKHYFPISSSLLKNEEGTKLAFLDSLKFNREGKEEVFSCF